MKQLILVLLLISRYSHSRFFTKDPQLERHHTLYDPCRLSITGSSLKKPYGGPLPAPLEKYVFHFHAPLWNPNSLNSTIDVRLLFLLLFAGMVHAWALSSFLLLC